MKMMNTETPRPKYKRRHYLINKRFQLGWIAGLFCVALGAMLLTALATSYYFLFVAAASPIEVQEDPIARMINLGVWFGICAAGLIVAGVLITHRTAGPMYRMLKVLKELESGNLSIRMRLRSRDHWHEVADAFNAAAEALETKSAAARERIAEAEASIRELMTRFPEEAVLQSVSRSLSDLRQSLG